MPLKRRLSEGGDEDSNPAQESKKKKSDVASQMQVRNRKGFNRILTTKSMGLFNQRTLHQITFSRQHCFLEEDITLNLSLSLSLSLFLYIYIYI